jgi:hypothetical protein
VRIRLALTLDLHRDPPPTPDDKPAPPRVDEKGCTDLTRRTTPDAQLGFQPRDVEA